MRAKMMKKFFTFIIVCGIIINFGSKSLASGPLNNEVTLFDVSDIAFSVLWQVDEPSKCDLKLYDASDNLLNTSSYSKYIDSADVGAGSISGYSAAEEHGIMVVTIYNLPPNAESITEYHIRTVTTPRSGGQIIYPPEGQPAIVVTTMISPTGVQLPPADNSSRWVEILDNSGQPAEGAIILVNIDGASYSVSDYRPGEMKSSWVDDFGWAGFSLENVYQESDNKSFLLLYRPEDAGIDATVKAYGGDRGMWERRIEDFWSKKELDVATNTYNFLYDGSHYTLTLEFSSNNPPVIEGLQDTLLLLKEDQVPYTISNVCASDEDGVEWIELEGVYPSGAVTFTGTGTQTGRRCGDIIISWDDTIENIEQIVTVIASDGEAEGRAIFSFKLSSGKPGPCTVAIGPVSAKTGDSVWCEVTSPSENEDDITDYRFEWIKNGNTSPLFTERKSMAPYDSVLPKSTLAASYTAKGDKIKCRVTPYDDDGEGRSSETVEITISNTPPNPPLNADITPLDPEASENLICILTEASVPDPDTEDSITYYYTWKSTGASTRVVSHGPTTKTTDTLLASQTARGEAWVCEVSAYDGTDQSTVLLSNKVSISNNPPTQPTGIKITRQGKVTQINEVKLSEDSSLVCMVSSPSVDPDEDTVQYIFRWKSNKKSNPITHGPQSGLTDSLSLLALDVNAQKGEVWICEVSATDGMEESEPGGSNTVTIINSPPKKPQITLTPDKTKVHADDEIKCLVTSAINDVDGDVVKYTYTWTTSGIDPIVHSNKGTMDILDPSRSVTAKGQVWTCSVKPNDGEVEGPISLIEFEIINQKPRISQIPEQQWDEGALYDIEITAVDPDDDALSYEADIPSYCEWIDFDNVTHTFNAHPPEGSSGAYSIKISVTDGSESDEAEISIIVRSSFIVIDDFEYPTGETFSDNDWDELQIGYGRMIHQEDEIDPENHYLSMEIISPSSTQDENAQLHYAIAKWLDNPDLYNYPELQFEVQEDELFYVDAYVGARDESGKTLNFFIRYIPDESPHDKNYEVFGNRITYYIGSKYRSSDEIKRVTCDLEEDLYDAIFEVTGRKIRYKYLIAIVLRGSIDYVDNMILRPGSVDMTAPLDVVDLIPSPRDGAVKLFWQINPNQYDDVLGYRIYKNDTLIAIVSEDATDYLVMGLNNNVEYTFKVTAVDNSREINESVGVTVKIKPQRDITPPEDVINFIILAGNKMVTLQWDNPENQSADLAGYKIYQDGDDYTEPIAGSVIIPKTAHGINVYGLQNDVLYTFTIIAIDESGNPSGGVSRSTMPNTNTNTILDDFDTDYAGDDTILSHGWSQLHGEGTFTRMSEGGNNYCALRAVSSNPLDFILSKWIAHLDDSQNPKVSFKVRSTGIFRVEFYVKAENGENYFVGYQRGLSGPEGDETAILQDKWIIYTIPWNSQNEWQQINRNLDTDLYGAINVHFTKILGILVRGVCDIDTIELIRGVSDVSNLTARPGNGYVDLSWTLAVNNRDNEAFNLCINGNECHEITIAEAEDVNNDFVFRKRIENLTHNEEYEFKITHVVGGQESTGVSIKALPRNDYCVLFNDESFIADWELESQAPEITVKERFDNQVQSTVMTLGIDKDIPYPQRFMIGREVPLEYNRENMNCSFRLKADNHSDFIIWFNLKGISTVDYWIAFLPAQSNNLVSTHNNYGIFAYYYLDSGLRDNRWHSISINLNDILTAVMDDELLEINEIYFGGRLSIDDVMLF
ncbi:MAG: hypothetical protein ACMUJM_05880 [bacterium]